MRKLLCLLMLLFLPAFALAQEKLSVELITIGPGDSPPERYGHNMLRVYGPAGGTEVVYNWGIYSFDESNFILDFVQGRLWYWMAGTDTQRMLDYYRGEDRTIWVQELNLSPAQAKSLLDFCEWNAQPANRRYRYDYFRDNCSTRVRDALDQTLKGQIKQQATSQPSEVTFRSETRRLMAPNFPLYLSLNFVLGTPTDKQLSAWEEMFIPMRLRERLAGMSIVDERGDRISLVRRETIMHQSGHIQERAAPPQWIGLFLLAGMLIGSGQGWLGYRARQGSRRRTWAFGTAAVLWSLLGGLGGSILAYFWCFTDHAATRPNENILQLGPWSLVLVVVIPLALRRFSPSAEAKGSRGGAMKLAVVLTLIAAGFSLLGMILKLLPIMIQVNGEIIALAVPAHAGLAWGIWQLSAARSGAPVETERSTA